jgi:hypothetical protein
MQQAVTAAILSQTLSRVGWRSSDSRKAPRSNRRPRNPSKTPGTLCDRAPRVGPQFSRLRTLALGLHPGLQAQPDVGPPARASTATSGIRRECARCEVASNAMLPPQPAHSREMDPSIAPPASALPNAKADIVSKARHGHQQRMRSGGGGHPPPSSSHRHSEPAQPLPRCEL